MRINRYNWIIVLRVVLIAFTCYAFIWFLTETDRYVSILLCFVLLISQIYLLIHYLNRINRDLANFLIFLQEDDTTLAYSKKRVERNFGNVIIDLDRIVKKLHLAGVEKAQQQHFINAIVEQVNVGLIAFTKEGEIDLMNQAAINLFGITKNNNITNLTNRYPELTGVLNKNNDGDPTLTKIKKDGRTIHLAVKTTILRFSNEEMYLVSFDDIQSEIEAQEIEAWRKLIRVLRHEIMNSITPILTLTTAIRRSFILKGEVKTAKFIKDENIIDALESAQVIEERSNALITFVEKFKDLTTPPSLKIKTFTIIESFRRIGILFAKEFEQREITFDFRVTPENLLLTGDQELIEQILINLTKNSIEALTNKRGNINLHARIDSKEKVIIQVIDNGCGIASEYLDSIFIPSFTTKEHGMGIGLSLSKQIMNLHQGSISVISNNKETCFELKF